MRAFASIRLGKLGLGIPPRLGGFFTGWFPLPDGADGEPEEAFKRIRRTIYNSQHPSRGAQRLRWTHGHPPLNSFSTWCSRIIALSALNIRLSGAFAVSLCNCYTGLSLHSVRK